jgi:replicative DNA helicase
LYVKTLGAPPASEIDRLARLMVMRNNVKLIGVDYIQLIRNGQENRVQDVSESSGLLRGMALRYHIPMIANSQMSRAIVHRGEDAEPELSDLRESGSLEQDATMVWFPREVWQRPTEGQLRMFPQNINHANNTLYPMVKAIPIRVHIKKNRNGGVGATDPILWIKSTNQFRTLTGLGENR